MMMMMMMVMLMMMMMMRPEVDSVVLHMCAFGMVAQDNDGEAPVQIATRIMSSAPEVLRRLNGRCTSESCERSERHRHVRMMQGRAKLAQVYPRKFGVALCEGVAAQKRLDSLGLQTRPVMTLRERCGRLQRPRRDLSAHRNPCTSRTAVI